MLVTLKSLPVLRTFHIGSDKNLPIQSTEFIGCFPSDIWGATVRRNWIETKHGETKPMGMGQRQEQTKRVLGESERFRNRQGPRRDRTR